MKPRGSREFTVHSTYNFLIIGSSGHTSIDLQLTSKQLYKKTVATRFAC